MTNWFKQHQPQVVWVCPELPASPKASAALIAKLVKDWPQQDMVVIGSSLGGFYATWAAAQWRCKGLLLNPAVHPARDLVPYIGQHPVWQNPSAQIDFDPAYIDELKDLYVGAGLAWLSDATAVTAAPDAQDLLAVIATGDEVLDWREMSARYAHVQQHLIQGSDHGLTDFELHWPVLKRFFQFF